MEDIVVLKGSTQFQKKSPTSRIDQTLDVLEDKPCGFEEQDDANEFTEQPIHGVGCVAGAHVGPRKALAWGTAEHDQVVGLGAQGLQERGLQGSDIVGEELRVRVISCIGHRGLRVGFDCENDGYAGVSCAKAHAASASKEIDADECPVSGHGEEFREICAVHGAEHVVASLIVNSYSSVSPSIPENRSMRSRSVVDPQCPRRPAGPGHPKASAALLGRRRTGPAARRAPPPAQAQRMDSSRPSRLPPPDCRHPTRRVALAVYHSRSAGCMQSRAYPSTRQGKHRDGPLPEQKSAVAGRWSARSARRRCRPSPGALGRGAGTDPATEVRRQPAGRPLVPRDHPARRPGNRSPRIRRCSTCRTPSRCPNSTSQGLLDGALIDADAAHGPTWGRHRQPPAVVEVGLRDTGADDETRVATDINAPVQRDTHGNRASPQDPVPHS